MNVTKELPKSLHTRHGWEGQLARASRWLDRLMKANSPDDIEDFLYAFFQNMHHLRDWSPNNKTKAQCDQFIGSNLATRICRDIANLTKHRKLDRQPAQGCEPSLVRESAGGDAGECKGWFGDNARIAVATNYQDRGIVLDARVVARECLRLWCDHLSPCTIVSEIKEYFQFSVNEFDRMVQEAAWRQELFTKISAQLMSGE